MSISSVLIVIFVLIVCIPVFFAYFVKASTDKRQVATKRAIELINEHLSTLSMKRHQCVYTDDYGKEAGLDDWAREVVYFTDQVINTDREISRLSPVNATTIQCLVDERLELYVPDAVPFDTDLLTGPDYEVYCADVLRRHGWSIVRKGGTGDQGVDLVAIIGNLRVAIQCKRYGQPVGNKAVQEVAAGRQFEQCDIALVVSNADYTPSARQLASALGVMLLHHSELPGLREHVQKNFPTLISGEASV
ncbi:restriction endonuclease [Aromatoleum toluvorans]|uniref:Restriction endonuclease n=1 Tax=Aromatoleum toluvorans TaxID=92002 RepID=A0ABX1Q0D3_9RHOO|nr:restriction endonuclease [Aromatoleum toluvorans]NMG43985.1 restriction endonuclease [Aromatoleum toluvorans]